MFFYWPPCSVVLDKEFKVSICYSCFQIRGVEKNSIFIFYRQIDCMGNGGGGVARKFFKIVLDRKGVGGVCKEPDYQQEFLSLAL